MSLTRSVRRRFQTSPWCEASHNCVVFRYPSVLASFEMDEELPTHPFNRPPDVTEGSSVVWLVSYADDDDRELSARQISDALGRGEIDPGTIVWRDGMADWQPISDLPELKEQLKAFANETAALRKKRTVMGGFGASVGNLPPQAKSLPRLPVAPTPNLPRPNLPSVPVATVTRGNSGNSPGQAPRPPAPLLAKAPVASKDIPAPAASAATTPAPTSPSNLAALDQATRQRKTLLGTGFKVPPPGAAGKLPGPRLPGLSGQPPLPPKPAAAPSESVSEATAELDSALLEPVPAFEAVREAQGALGLGRRAATETPTLPLPPVRAKLPLAGAVDAEDDPPTVRPATQAKQQAQLAGRPRQPKPHSPHRPSRPPPEHAPSAPPSAGNDAEPISLGPESLEAISSDALDSVVASLPALEAPSAPALRAAQVRLHAADPGQPARPRPLVDRLGPSVVPVLDDIEPESIEPESIEPESIEPESAQAVSFEPETLDPAAHDAQAPAISVALESLNAAFKNEPIPLSVPKGAAAAAAVRASGAVLPSVPPQKRGRGKILLAALTIAGLGTAVFFLNRQKAPIPVASPAAETVAVTAEPARVDAPQAAVSAEPEDTAQAAPTTAPEPAPDSVGATPRPRGEIPAAVQPIAPTEPETAVKNPPPEPATPAPDPVPEAPVKPAAPSVPKISGDPESASDGPTGPFDPAAASAALERAAGRASACRKPGDPSGVARVSVSFANSGRATRAIVNGPPFAGTATGGCIAGAMQGARIPQFTGDRVTVTKKVVIQ
ncbi:MAG: hypothetical protein RJA70_3363 [Pseudomonadota bacterium]|jgi:hypothetical protein